MNINNLDIGNPVLQKYFEETKKQSKFKIKDIKFHF